MAQPTSHWLLDPTFPAAGALPRLDRELFELANADEPTPSSEPPSALYPSGTWLVGERTELEATDDEHAERFATSDSEAPTVRPGSLYARQAG